MAKYDHLKETLYNFYKNNSHLGRKAIYDRFIELGLYVVLVVKPDENKKK